MSNIISNERKVMHAWHPTEADVKAQRLLADKTAALAATVLVRDGLVSPKKSSKPVMKPTPLMQTRADARAMVAATPPKMPHKR